MLLTWGFIFSMSTVKVCDCLNLKCFWVKKIFFGLFSVKSDCTHLLTLLKAGLRKSSGHHVAKKSLSCNTHESG